MVGNLIDALISVHGYLDYRNLFLKGFLSLLKACLCVYLTISSYTVEREGGEEREGRRKKWVLEESSGEAGGK